MQKANHVQCDLRCITNLRVSVNIKARLDALILKIKEDIQGSSKPQDIVCVTHRHIALALALLLTGIPFQYGSKFAIETAGIMVLQYVMANNIAVVRSLKVHLTACIKAA